MRFQSLSAHTCLKYCNKPATCAEFIRLFGHNMFILEDMQSNYTIEHMRIRLTRIDKFRSGVIASHV